MALEPFLIVLHDDVSLKTTEELLSFIVAHGGKINLVAGQGRAMIATFDNLLAEPIRRLHCVKLLGGVTIGKRKISRNQIGK